MSENQGRPNRVSRRAILTAIPVGAVAGAIAGKFDPRGDPPAPAPAAPEESDSSGNREYVDVTQRGVVGDGRTDVASALNEILTSTPAGHDVFLPSGTYLIGDRLRLTTGVGLRGAGRGSTTVRLADGAGAPFILATDETGIQISGITFDGGDQGTEAISLQIDGCSVVDVFECAFVRMKHAIHVYSSGTSPSSDVRIHDNTFSDIVDFAIRASEGSEEVYIERNTIIDVSKGEAPSPAAIYVRGVNILVSENTVKASEDTAVLVAGDKTRHVTIANNVLASTLVAIFFGSGARSGLISGNRIRSTRDFGIHLFDREGSAIACIVTQNHIMSSGKTGIQAEGVSGFVISANIINNPAQGGDQQVEWRCGIALTATDAGPASNFVITGNVISSSSDESQMEHAILVASGSSGVEITSNVMSGSVGKTVYLRTSLREPYYVDTIDEIRTSRRFQRD